MEKTLDSYPVRLETGDTIAFNDHGVTRRARINYPVVFPDGAAVAEHFRVAGIGLAHGDVFTLLDEHGNPLQPNNGPDFNAAVQPQATLETQHNPA